MAVIALEGMKFQAYHGYYDEEQLMGGEFILDVYVTKASVAQAAASDDLLGTINYETIYFICKSEMKKTSKMIETVAQNILNRLRQQYDGEAQNIKVRLRKMYPPMGGPVECAYIEIESGGSSGGGGKGKSVPAFDDDDDDFDDEALLGSFFNR
ncbi:MAG: dihydroneopterin aldolase [Bacteroidota bacterium]